MTSRNELTLNDALHVPNIQKNLVSSSLLSKNGVSISIYFGQICTYKNDMFVKKGYLNEKLFKLNVMTVLPSTMNKITFSYYLLETFNFWHERLGYVKYNTLCRLIKLDLLSKYDLDLITNAIYM